jgi:hypothetical protein
VAEGRSPDELHRLAAVARDLELAEAGDPVLGPALATDEEDVKVLDVLGFGAVRRPGPRRRPQRGQSEPCDRETDEHRGDDHPDAHACESTQAFLIARPATRRGVRVYDRCPSPGRTG